MNAYRCGLAWSWLNYTAEGWELAKKNGVEALIP
jgi:hypothetical protein